VQRPLATVAIALNALWPLLADARPSAPFDPLHVLCTATPADAPAAPAVPPADGSDAKHHLPGCALCSIGAHHAALPVSHAAAVAAIAACDQLHTVRSTVPPQRDASQFAAPPRAPPALS